jgi:hypothetical protein
MEWVGWLVGWLVCLVGWLVGWLVRPALSCTRISRKSAGDGRAPFMGPAATRISVGSSVAATYMQVHWQADISAGAIYTQVKNSI